LLNDEAIPNEPVTGDHRSMTQRQQSARVMRILMSEKIKAQKKLVAEFFGGDESQWDKLTQKELDYFWQNHCSRHVLVHVNGELKYVPFDSIEAKGSIQ
jgi:hypothetical protein